MNISLNSNINQLTSLLKESVLMTPQHKRIFAVVVFAFSCLALCYYTVNRYCFKVKTKVKTKIKEKPVKIIQAKPLEFPVTEWNFRKDSTYETSSDLPEGYKWVVGEDWMTGKNNAQTFMEEEEDPYIITAVTRFACDDFYLGIPTHLQLHIRDLITHARTEGKITAIIYTIANSKKHVRAVFSALFKKMKTNESDEVVVKLQLIRGLLSDDQLMDILALDNRKSNGLFYQIERDELEKIGADNYILYQDILNLPPAFIKRCEALSQYEKYVRFEAAKEKNKVDKPLIRYIRRNELMLSQ